MHSRRQFLSAALAAGLAYVPTEGNAQDYPSRPVRIIVPFAPGGVDVTARIIADRLSAALGQPFIIENRPGAGGSVGAKIVASADPDGHTLMFSTPGPVVVSPLINRNAGYDALKNFAAIALVAQSPLLLVIYPALPINSVQQLVDFARANPGKVYFPSPGFGTQPHLVGEMFKLLTGVEIVHVPYRGSAPAITDLLVGQMQIYFDHLANLRQHVESGRLKAIAITGERRSPILPAIPTMAESGFAGIDVTYWNGLFAPAGTPLPIVQRLHELVNQALAMPDVRTAINKLGTEPRIATIQDFAGLIAEETVRWSKVVRDANIKVE